MLVIKTRSSRVDDVAAYVRANHPYEVPEVISMPVSDFTLSFFLKRFGISCQVPLSGWKRLLLADRERQPGVLAMARRAGFREDKSVMRVEFINYSPLHLPLGWLSAFLCTDQ